MVSQALAPCPCRMELQFDEANATLNMEMVWIPKRAHLSMSLRIQSRASPALPYHKAGHISISRLIRFMGRQALAETSRRLTEPRVHAAGTVPPFVMRFDAGSVPVGTLFFPATTTPSRSCRTPALNRVRPLFATIAGRIRAATVRGSAARLSYALRRQAARVQHVARRSCEANCERRTPLRRRQVRIGDMIPTVPVNGLSKTSRNSNPSRIEAPIQRCSSATIGTWKTRPTSQRVTRW